MKEDHNLVHVFCCCFFPHLLIFLYHFLKHFYKNDLYIINTFDLRDLKFGYNLNIISHKYMYL